jgi:hypothetical protein
MYLAQQLKIPKKEKQVTLWIHPEGRVIGSLFLSLQNKYYSGEEEPIEALNKDEPFLVLKREDAEDLRFYNKASIVCVEYYEESKPSSEGMESLHCRLNLMDGSMIEGTVRKTLPPDHSRLYDYLNMDGERFSEISTEGGIVCLVNKSYIVCVVSLSERHRGDVDWQQGDLATSGKPCV